MGQIDECSPREESIQSTPTRLNRVEFGTKPTRQTKKIKVTPFRLTWIMRRLDTLSGVVAVARVATSAAIERRNMVAAVNERITPQFCDCLLLSLCCHDQKSKKTENPGYSRMPALHALSSETKGEESFHSILEASKIF